MPKINLVPLGLGELLDQTFSYFRKHFWLLAGIMVLPEGLLVGLNILVQVFLGGIAPPRGHPTPQAAAQAAASAMRAGLVSITFFIPYFIVYAVALGATTYALSEVYLGRTTTIRESYRVVGRKIRRLLNVIFSILLRCVGIFILAFFLLAILMTGIAAMPKSLAWVSVIMGLAAFLGFILAGVLAVIFLVRYSVAVPALVLEGLSARHALKRSIALTKGFLWRLLLVAMLMVVIRFTLVALCQAPFTVAAFLFMAKGARPGLWLTIPSVLVGGAAGAATGPLLMVGFAIAYYDLRVRKEGFDLQLMMADLDGSNPLATAGHGHGKDATALEDSNIFGAVAWTILTGGIYQAYWFLNRRKALNNLQSPEKLGIAALTVALAAFIANFLFPFFGIAKWGSWVEAENALGPLHPLILLVAEVIIVVQCFKARRILVDHLAPREDSMFSASVRFQYDDLFSRAGTFFLGIFYLQYKINSLLDRLTAEQGGEGEIPAPDPLASLPPAVNS